MDNSKDQQLCLILDCQGKQGMYTTYAICLYQKNIPKHSVGLVFIYLHEGVD